MPRELVEQRGVTFSSLSGPNFKNHPELTNGQHGVSIRRRRRWVGGVALLWVFELLADLAELGVRLRQVAVAAAAAGWVSAPQQSQQQQQQQGSGPPPRAWVSSREQTFTPPGDEPDALFEPQLPPVVDGAGMHGRACMRGAYMLYRLAYTGMMRIYDIKSRGMASTDSACS